MFLTRNRSATTTRCTAWVESLAALPLKLSLRADRSSLPARHQPHGVVAPDGAKLGFAEAIVGQAFHRVFATTPALAMSSSVLFKVQFLTMGAAWPTLSSSAT